jgi:N-glycosylase/DNA lyase
MTATWGRDFKTEIRNLYKQIRENIEQRIAEFSDVWERGNEEEILCELLFCLLTPAARAHSAWNALEALRSKGLILNPSAGEAACDAASSHAAASCKDERRRRIADVLRTVRFRHNKARNVMEAEAFFTVNGKAAILCHLRRCHTIPQRREWLAATVRGMGHKEASHFLRNIGMGDGIAILDRHILRCLKRLNIIDQVPEGLTKKRYLEIEQRMRRLAEEFHMPLSHLDILFWYHETGEIFK